jgi:hypothetical protein
MDLNEVSFSVEHFLINDFTKKVSEADIREHYRDNGYSVFTSRVYSEFLRGERKDKLLKDYEIDDNIKSIFKEYKSGYPDILIIKNNILTFIEIKLDGDSLRPNQILFLNNLSKITNVKVVYFTNINIIENTEIVKRMSTDAKVDRSDGNILKQLTKYDKIRQIKKYKPFWLISVLYKEFGMALLKKEYLGIIASSINETKDKVIWFVRKLEEEKENKIQIKSTKKNTKLAV